MMLTSKVLFTSIIALFAGSVVASEEPQFKKTPEYYWGIGTDTSTQNPEKVGKELFVGKRTFDPKSQVILDDQTALGESGEVRPQTYTFDLKTKTVEVRYGKKIVGSGSIIDFVLSKDGKDVQMLEYEFATTGEGAYQYHGKD